MILPEGLPRRPWYRHAIYAPGFYTGYGVKTVPGVREAIEERKWDEAREQIAMGTSIFRNLTSAMNVGFAAFELLKCAALPAGFDVNVQK